MPADRPTIAVTRSMVYCMVNHGVPWYTMVYHGTTAMCYNTVVPWHIIVYCCVHNDIPWCAMVRLCSNTSQSYSGTPWYTTVQLRCVVTLSYHDIQWYTVYTIHHGIPWYVVYIRWYTVVYHCTANVLRHSCLHSIPCLQHVIAWHGTPCSLEIVIFALLSCAYLSIS